MAKKTTTTEPKETAPPKEMCRVFDTNAKQGPRIHHVAGTDYTLYATGEGTEIPLDDALMFLKDPAFVVLDHRGKQMKMQGPADQRPDIVLPPHQTIANLEELSMHALLVRAKKLPGSQSLTKNSGRRKVITLIMAGGIPEAVITAPMDEETEDLISDDDDDDAVATAIADQAIDPDDLRLPPGA